jgi:hypothetical protein
VKIVVIFQREKLCATFEVLKNGSLHSLEKSVKMYKVA